MKRNESDIRRNKRRAEQFLTRLNWKIYEGEIKEITTFQVDVYKFVIMTPLTEENLEKFMVYIRKLDMTELRSTLKIFVWLYQHKVCFKLKFGWNRNLPVWYSLKNLFMPMKIRRTLLAYGHDDLMSCPVEEMEKKGE